MLCSPATFDGNIKHAQHKHSVFYSPVSVCTVPRYLTASDSLSLITNPGGWAAPLAGQQARPDRRDPRPPPAAGGARLGGRQRAVLRLAVRRRPRQTGVHACGAAPAQLNCSLVFSLHRIQRSDVTTGLWRSQAC